MTKFFDNLMKYMDHTYPSSQAIDISEYENLYGVLVSPCKN